MVISSCFGSSNVGEVSGASRPTYDADANEFRERSKPGKFQKKILGRDEDIDLIKSILLKHETEGSSNLSLTAIIGIGGLGKTALARYIYAEADVARHFGARVWFPVTERLDLKALEMEFRRASVKKEMSKERLLLVLDDVWDHSVGELNQWLRRALGCCAPGSKVIVTTRSQGVERGMGGESSTALTHHLQGISADDCWELFKERAFGSGPTRIETPQLESIGREIADKCQGVPLIAIAIGSFLQFERDRSAWENVRESEIWKVSDLASKALSVLKLSYDQLPHDRLRKCFMYCSLFPKAHGIDRGKLVELWAGEGLVSGPDTEGEAPAEDVVGEQYFTELLLRSFFEEETDEYRTTTYKMHDLFHDLAQSLVGGEHVCATAAEVDDGTIRITPECRRLLIKCEWLTSTIPRASFRSSRRLETLLLLMRNHWIEDTTYKCSILAVPLGLFSNLKNLRMLDLNSINIAELPSSVGRLKQLRYLNLSQTEIVTLPKSIGKLKNLQVLNLRLCSKLKELPKSIKKLRNLIVLDLQRCDQLHRIPDEVTSIHGLKQLRIELSMKLLWLDRTMPRGLSRLTRLQTLTNFFVDEDIGCSVAELEGLNGLCGEINISNLDWLDDPEVARKASLKQKHRLQKLGLYWFHPDRCEPTAGSVFQELQPHPNLEELVVGGYQGSDWPSWMGTSTIELSLKNLVRIELGAMCACKRLPPLGQLPSLKDLRLRDLTAVEQLGDDFYGENGDRGAFPVLEELEIWGMSALKEWSLPATGGAEVFPRLNYLAIERCPLLTMLPSLPRVDLLRLDACGDLLSEESLRGVKLPSLKDLILIQIPVDSGWDGLRHLTTVHSLSLCEYRKLNSLPEGVRHLTGLRALHLRRCYNLGALPEWLDFPSLEALKIEFCPKLSSLAESLRRLPGVREVEVNGTSEQWDQHSVQDRDLDDWKRENGLAHIRSVKFQSWGDLTVDEPEQEWGGVLSVNRGLPESWFSEFP